LSNMLLAGEVKLFKDIKLIEGVQRTYSSYLMEYMTSILKIILN